MNLEVKKQNRIELRELITLLKGDESEAARKLVLERATDYWVSDHDLYRAVLALEDMPPHRMLAKTLETVTVIPSTALGEERRPLSNEELEALKKQVNEQ